MVLADTGHIGRRAFLGAAGTAGVAGLGGCISGTGGGTATLKIGLVSPFSGGYGFYGEAQKRGAELEFELANASDDVLPDVELELVVGDTKTDPEVGLSAVRELIVQKEVDHLMGATSSAVANAIRNFVKDRAVTYTIVGAASAYLTNGENCNRKTFRTHNHTGIFGEMQGFWSTERLGTDAYVLYQDYTFGYSFRDHVLSGIERAGGTVVGMASQPLGGNDFAGVITEIIDADPDWLFMGMVGTGGVPFFTQAAQRGLDVPCSGMPSPSAMGKLTTEQFEKLPEIYYPIFDYLLELDTPGNERFVPAFRERYGQDPIFDDVGGYVPAKFVANMLDAAGAPEADLDEIIAAGEGLSWESPRGELTIRPCDHQAASPMYPTKLASVAGEGAAVMERIEGPDGEPEVVDGTGFQDPCDEIDCRMGD